MFTPVSTLAVEITAPCLKRLIDGQKKSSSRVSSLALTSPSMDDETNAQTIGKREIVTSLDREFARLHFNTGLVIEHTSLALLYCVPPQEESLSASRQLPSIGESVLRSAAAIEQAFGG